MRAVMRHILLTMCLLVPHGATAQLQWREVPQHLAAEQHPDAAIEVYGRDGVIYVRTPRRVEVKVFTILGQNVSQATLPPGLNMLNVASRGIYMVRIGNVTYKVPL